MDGLFPDEFANLVELDIPETTLVVSRIISGSKEVSYTTEPEIRQRVGERNIELKLAQICFFLTKADTHPSYIFYSRGRKDLLRVICASWGGDGWYLAACATGYPDELRNGCLLVSLEY